MNSTRHFRHQFAGLFPRACRARRFTAWALPLFAALGMLMPQAWAAMLKLDFAKTGGAEGTGYATGWNAIFAPQQNNTQINATNIGGLGYNFTFANVASYDNGIATQPLTRSGFYTFGNSANAHGFTLTGLNPNLPVKLYACATWDGNPAGGYIVYGDNAPAGVRAQTVGSPGTSPTLANLTLIGTATADATGMVSGALYGRDTITAGYTEGQAGGFVFVPTQILTSSAGSNGSISPLGTTNVFAGTNQAYTITADTGYHVADVQVDGVSVGAVTSYTITNVNRNSAIVATFAADTVSYTITASAGANGSISPSGDVSAFQGTTEPFTITPGTGYHVADVLVDGSSVGAVAGYSFTNISAGHTISASFAINTYTITASAGANGAISPGGTTSVNHGGSQGYAITADTGYYIVELIVDGVTLSAAGSYTFTNVTAGHTITATFDNRTRLYLDFASGPAGSYTSGWTPVYATNLGDTMVNVTNVGGSGYNFTFGHAGSYDNGNSGESLTRSGFYNFGNITTTHPFTLTGLIPGQAVSLYACAGWNGNGTAATVVFGDSGPSGKHALTVGDPGTSPTLSNLTLIGRATVDVTGAVTGSMNGYGGAGAANEGQLGGFVFAIEAPPVFAVTVSAGDHGSISPGGPVTLTSGGSQTFTITPDTGYDVADVLVDGVTVGAVGSYAFNTIMANHSISASFIAIAATYDITASAGDHGAISPSGAVNVSQGVNKKFDITPAAGYHVANVLIDAGTANEVSAGAVAVYWFNNVAANHTISASFAIDTFTITASADSNGSISPVGTTTVNFGDSPTFTLTGASGYHVDYVLVDGVSVGAVTSYTFTNVTANHTISAVFDNHLRLALDFSQTGRATTSGWTPVYANGVADTMVNVANVGGSSYGFTFDHVGAWDNGNGVEPLTRSGFYNFRDTDNTLTHGFTLAGLNAGQVVALYACAGWNGNGSGGYVVFGDSGTAGKRAQTVGDPGSYPLLSNLTLIGTATADGAGTVTGSLNGVGGVGSNTEGQVGAFVFMIVPGATVQTPFQQWASAHNLAGNAALPGADPDGDGVSNLMEFALNSDPASSASTGRSFARIATVDSTPNVLTLTIAVRSDATTVDDGNRQKLVAAADNVTYTIEASTNLGNWGGVQVTEVTGTDATNIQSSLALPDPGWSYRTFRTTGSAATNAADFIRVGVE